MKERDESPSDALGEGEEKEKKVKERGKGEKFIRKVERMRRQ